MEPGVISQWSVSSMNIIYSNFSSTFRLGTESMGGAWCPKPMISQFSYEYLQIDLGKLVVITMVEIQGRFGNGQVIDNQNKIKMEEP